MVESTVRRTSVSKFAIVSILTLPFVSEAPPLLSVQRSSDKATKRDMSHPYEVPRAQQTVRACSRRVLLKALDAGVC